MSYEFGIPNAPNEIFRSLADPTRRAIYEQIVRHGEQNVRALTDHAGISQAAVSKHLGVLKQAGLVKDRPAGRTVHYSAEPNGLEPLMDWAQYYAAFWQQRFERLEQTLDGMDEV